jgi:hypothetical protein
MGTCHHRYWLSFSGLMDPGRLPEIKRKAIELEQAWSKNSPTLVERPINLDPGLLMRGRLVLATTKDFSHRLYLGQGIYGEVTAQFKKNKVISQAWTYPDIAAGHYDDFLIQARQSYQKSLKDLSLD